MFNTIIDLSIVVLLLYSLYNEWQLRKELKEKDEKREEFVQNMLDRIQNAEDNIQDVVEATTKTMDTLNKKVNAAIAAKKGATKVA